MKIKVCGMKYQENIESIATLSPDYLGFIFYEKSPRNFEGDIPTLPDTIKKTGVFVNASIEFITKRVQQYGFRAVQLHGNESVAFCKELKVAFQNNQPAIEIFKVFSIKDEFDFSLLKPYEGIVDYFLFDTKGKEKGGNGFVFDWNVLNNYNASTPFILSGGIGLDQVDSLLSFLKHEVSEKLYAIDVNSKFEIKPGVKNTEDLKKFMNLLSIKS